ncbi:MAG TPA: EAL domain-containing protein [Clostridia bacterium]|nr:EAL domain-containing protein [Clostridia bacterium]
MVPTNTENQFGLRIKQRQSKQIETLEAELEEKTKKLKEYEKLFGGLSDGKELTAEIKETSEAPWPEESNGTRIKTELEKALEREEFEIYYQPIAEVANGKTAGVEVLLRWCNPELGLLHPDRFISLAERTGLIIPIGEWVLYKACSRYKAWQDAGYPSLRLAVNISAVQLQNTGFVPMVEKMLKETGINPNNLELEITESVVFDNLDYAVSTINELRAMGLRISIDDFGTGYSSLEYLNRLPVNTLKIDKSFIKSLAINPSSKAIVSAIIAMAHKLNIEVIAEGVESCEQLDFLRKERCHFYQGFLCSPPVPVMKFEEIYMSASLA